MKVLILLNGCSSNGKEVKDVLSVGASLVDWPCTLKHLFAHSLGAHKWVKT